MKPTEKQDRLLWVTVTALCLATFFADWVTALGYAVWCFYFIAVGMTLFQSKKSVPYLTALFSTILVVIGVIYSVAMFVGAGSEALLWSVILGAAGLPVRIISRWLNGSSPAAEAIPAAPPGSSA